MNFWGKSWKIVYEHVMNIDVRNGEIIAIVSQFVRDDDGHSDLREFSAWAPVLEVKSA